ncbi:UDP-glycosyltransferase 86a1 [Phtheirospermum japonicum]|uniref:UDP-glycosyltransferase 86a1 n=1 Tax=Phtheirospermum japonicum TaxID=374723 RepID=A0A830CBE4_9LAMI|nr:UDP-glycosyltransferase 86a1 [Phtheirospermum japonicum]
MISFHLRGHIIPFINLAIKLASKGFTITFAHIDYIHHQISKSHHNITEMDIFARARNSGLDIHYTTISDGLPIGFDRAANFNLHLENFLYQFPDKVDEQVGKIITQPDSDSDYFLIADTFCVWPEKIAKKYNLVNVSFWTEPALVFSLYYHLDLLREKGHIPVTGRQENVDYIPGISSINTKDFVSYFQDSGINSVTQNPFPGFRCGEKRRFHICNTVQELGERKKERKGKKTKLEGRK